MLAKQEIPEISSRKFRSSACVLNATCAQICRFHQADLAQDDALHQMNHDAFRELQSTGLSLFLGDSLVKRRHNMLELDTSQCFMTFSMRGIGYLDLVHFVPGG